MHTRVLEVAPGYAERERMWELYYGRLKPKQPESKPLAEPIHVAHTGRKAGKRTADDTARMVREYLNEPDPFLDACDRLKSSFVPTVERFRWGAVFEDGVEIQKADFSQQEIREDPKQRFERRLGFDFGYEPVVSRAVDIIRSTREAAQRSVGLAPRQDIQDPDRRHFAAIQAMLRGGK